MAKPYVSASSVAALIGANPYKDADAAFFELLSQVPKWRRLVSGEQRVRGVTTADAAFERVVTKDAALQATLASAVSVATAATTDQGVEAAIQAAVSSAVSAVADPALREVVAEGVRQTVQTRRGTRLEAGALDGYERTHGTAVSRRNEAMMYWDGPHYKLGGRIDGYDAATRTVIEVKNRKRAWAHVPPYDIIQLRAYLVLAQHNHPAGAVAGAEVGTGMCDGSGDNGGQGTQVQGKLVERFPDGSTRETVVTHDAAEWARIDEQLQQRVCARLAALTECEVQALVARHCCIATTSIA